MGKEKIFIDNLKRINSSETVVYNLKFSSWLLRCPLLLLYLNPAKKDAQAAIKHPNELWYNLLTFFTKVEDSNKEIDIEWFRDNSIYNSLAKVSIYSCKKTINRNNKTITKNINNDTNHININNINKPIPFSLAKGNKLKYTIERLNRLYVSPKMFLKKNEETIDAKIKIHFNNEIRALKTQTNKMRLFCRESENWGDVIEKINNLKK